MRRDYDRDLAVVVRCVPITTTQLYSKWTDDGVRHTPNDDEWAKTTVCGIPCREGVASGCRGQRIYYRMLGLRGWLVARERSRK